MPKFELYLDLRAKEDIAISFEYYEDRSMGLGKRFAKDVDQALNTIRKNPFFQIRYDDYRCYPLTKFPFMVHYTLDEDAQKIYVYGIVHTSLGPGKSRIKR